jgi:DNA-binding response OmpR family regulator
MQLEILQERVRQLEDTLKAGESEWVKFGLCGTECGIFAAMMNIPVLRRDSMQLLMATTQDDAVTDNAEAVAIYRMRRKLKPYGIEITTVPHLGYRLTNEMKERARGVR